MTQADKRELYETVAEMINIKLDEVRLDTGHIEVLDTPDHGEYCDTVSLWVGDDLYDHLYGEYRLKSVVDTVLGSIFTVKGNKYYIEPYNTTLLNIARY